MADSATDKDKEAPGRRPGGPALRRAAAGAALLLLLPLLLALLALAGLLASERMSRAALNAALDRAGAGAGIAVHAGELSGHWVSGIELRSVTISVNDTLLARIDTLRVAYDPRRLLGRAVDIEALAVAGVSVDLDRLPPSAAAEPEAPAGDRRLWPWRPLRVGTIALRDAAIRGRRLPGARSLAIADLDARIDRLALGPGWPAFAGAEIAARIAGDSSGALAGDFLLDAKASLGGDRLRVAHLALRSPGSVLHAAGELVLGGTEAIAAAIDTATLRVTAQPLDLAEVAAFVPGLDLAGRLDLEAELAGPRRDALSGHLTGTLAGFRHGAFTIPHAALDAALAEGRAELRLDTSLDGAPFAVRGWIRPFDREPAYELTGELARLPARSPAAVHRFAGSGDIAARLAMTGRGVRPEAMDARAAIELRPAFPARHDWGRGTISARLRSGVLGVEAALAVAGGTLDATGEADLARRQFSLSSAAFAGIDLSRLAPGTLPTALNGELTAAGRGFARDELRLTATLALAPSRIGRHDLERARLRAALDPGELAVNGELVLDGAVITLDRARLARGARPALEVAGLRVAHLDLARLSGRPRPATDLGGRLEATLESTRPLPAGGGASWLRLAASGALAGTARLDLAPSTFDTVRATSGRAEVRLAGGHLALDVAATTSAGRLALRGGATDLDGDPSFTLDELTAGDLDLAPWSGRPALASRLNVAATARGRGLRRGRLVLSGTLSLDPSRVAALNLTGGQLDFGVDDGRARIAGRIAGAGGAATLSAEAELRGERPEFAAAIDLEVADLAALLARHGEPGPPGSGRLEARIVGRGRTAGDLELTGQATGSGRLRLARLDSLALALRIAGGRVTIDSLVVRSPVAEVRAGGGVPLTTAGGEADLTFTARGRDLAPLAAIAGLDTLGVRSAAIEVRLRGRRDALRFAGTAGLDHLTMNDLRLARLSASANGRLDDSLQVAVASGELDLAGLRRAAFAISTLKAGVDLAGDSARVRVAARLSDADSLDAAGIMALSSEKRRITVQTCAVHQTDARWSLQAPATITLESGAFRIDDLVVAADQGPGLLAARGGIDRRGEQDLDIRLAAFRLGFLFALRGRPDLDGEMSGHLRLTGPAAAPAVDAALATSVRSVSAGEVVALDAHLESRNGALLLDGALRSPEAPLITFEGRLPFILSLAADSVAAGGPRLAGGLLAIANEPLALAVRGEDVPLHRFQPLLDPQFASELDGRLDIDVRVPGPAESPSGRARLEVREGRLGIPRWGVIYEQVALDTELIGNRLHLTRAEVRSGDGRAVLHGDLTFRRGALPTYDLALTADQFAALRSRDLTAVVSGALAATGSGDSLRVTGTIDPKVVEVYLDPLVAQRSGTEIELAPEDLELLAETFGYGALPGRTRRSSPLLARAEIDLRIVFPRGVWVRHRVEPKLAVELAGDIAVRKPRGGRPGFYGRIETLPRRGYVEQFGRQFDVREGELLIAGDPSTLTFDLRAEYRATPTNDPGETEIVITLDVAGTPEKLGLTLGSEPELSNSEIVSLIATGSTAGFSDRGSTTGTTAAGAAAGVGLVSMTGPMTAGVEEMAERAIGLDVVQIRQDGLRGTTLVAGKYVSPSLYVGFRQPITYQEKTTESTDSSEDFEIETEYSILDWLVLNLQGSGTVFRSYLRGRYAY